MNYYYSMESLTSDSDSRQFNLVDSPSSVTAAASDEETYATISTTPPKRRAGRTKFRETRHPVYKGVRRRNANKWVCEVREPNKKSRIWLGTFPTAEMAARAHDVAAMALRGRSACLNFADSAWLLPILKSDDANEIKKAAAKAAEAFRPPESDGSRDLTVARVIPSGNSTCFVEEEVVGDSEFGIQGYLANMAEGLMLSPPRTPPPQWGGGHYSHYWDDMAENNADVSLWSFSI